MSMSATPDQVKKFIEMVAPYAQNEYRKGRKILLSVCIAQACCESAYRTTEKMKNATTARHMRKSMISSEPMTR